MRARGTRPVKALLAALAAGALGFLLAGGLAGASRTATPISGIWRGGGHLLQISGDLASGFSVAAGESWTIIGCPISSGQVLTRYAPKGGTSYDATYLWTENTNGVCSSSTRGPETVTVVQSGANSLSITGCGYAFCGSLSRVTPPATTTRKTTTRPVTTTRPATTTAPRDTSPPRVQALAKGVTRPGTQAALNFRVTDDSGRARARVALFQGGEKVQSTQSGFGPANGSTWTWKAALGGNLVGPLYFCATAEDAAGNISKRSCAWISLLAPIAKVSNTCGGAGWDSIVAVQNYFGNRHTYQQSLTRSFSVDFSEACNLHDAGYGGHTVADSINGGIVDYHSWSRPRVDRKFLGDMRKLCDRTIPAWAKNAHEKCYSTGGTLSIGALALYNFVARHGWRFFDADLTVPGIQPRGHRANFD